MSRPRPTILKGARSGDHASQRDCFWYRGLDKTLQALALCFPSPRQQRRDHGAPRLLHLSSLQQVYSSAVSEKTMIRWAYCVLLQRSTSCKGGFQIPLAQKIARSTAGLGTS